MTRRLGFQGTPPANGPREVWSCARWIPFGACLLWATVSTLGCNVPADVPADVPTAAPENTGDHRRQTDPLGTEGGVAASVERSIEPCTGCNVILISVDTLRADHVGAYGYERPTTPNIDRLAARSTVFLDALSQSAWTRPAHFSMFTGLYPAEHGVIALSGPGRLPKGTPVLPEVLKRAGFDTAAFTGGANLDAHFGFDRGFDVYETFGKRMLDNVDAAIEWLDDRKDKPFFLFFHGFDPHRPYISDDEDRVALGLPTEPASGWTEMCKNGTPPKDIAPFLGNYDAAIHRGDRAIGKLLDAVNALGIADDTMVLLTSDHGEEFFEHGRCFHIYTLYREVLEVPLIVHIPGRSADTIEGVVPASVSIAPTVLQLLGLETAPLPGPSLLPSLAAGKSQFASVVSETSSRLRPGKPFGHVRAVTRDGEKLLAWLERDQVDYYDLAVDPDEQRSRPGNPRRQVLAERLAEWSALHTTRPRAKTKDAVLPTELAEQLRSLGYAE